MHTGRDGEDDSTADTISVKAGVPHFRQYFRPGHAAGDRPFLNNISPSIDAQAAHQQSLRFTTPGGRTHEHAFLLVIGKNPSVHSGQPDYGRRTRLDSGTLGIGAITQRLAGDVAHAALRYIRALQHGEAVSIASPPAGPQGGIGSSSSGEAPGLGGTMDGEVKDASVHDVRAVFRSSGRGLRSGSELD